MTTAGDYAAAKRLIEEHEAENLAAFKGKLRDLLTEHADEPGARELVFVLRRSAGLDREDDRQQRQAALLSMARA